MSHKNGCYNRKPFPRLIPLPATYVINIEGHAAVCEAEQMVPFVFDKTCVYQRNDRYNDPGCKGCTWKEENESE